MSTTNAVKAPERLIVAIIGNPNTGKSTVFSALTGVRSRVGNFPGVTVEKTTGRVQWDGTTVEMVDLPGTYSLAPRTIDEMVAVDVLLGRQRDVGQVDVVVCVVDASNLLRNFYLVSQLLEMQRPLVLVLNKWDLATQRSVDVDVEALSRKLGVHVVQTAAHRRVGLTALKQAILEVAGQTAQPRVSLFPAEFCEECDRLSATLREANAEEPSGYIVERLLLDVGGYIESRLTNNSADSLRTHLADARERLNGKGLQVPAIEAHVRYAWARDVLDGLATHPRNEALTASDKIDRLLTHRFLGLAVVCAMMFAVFQAIYRWATPFMNAIEAAQNWTGSLVVSSMAPGAMRSLLVDGVIAGVGGVIVFLPQIAILFFFIAILEDCGYMARTAFLMDRLMTKIGLSGKSFVPLMASFACAIPGVMATRVIENRRDRMITILIAPLMSCSARLPVYLLLIGAFIPSTALLGGWMSLQGLVLFAMTSIGVLVAIPVAFLLQATVFKGETPPFVLELPSYKWPSGRIVCSRVYDRSKAFLSQAGTLIVAATIVVWAAGYFPGDRSQLYQVQSQLERFEHETPAVAPERRMQLVQQRNQISGQLMAESILGRVGRAIEPVVKPLGWDWRIGVGVISSFPAREVIIATLGTIYSLGGDTDQQDQGLIGAMRAATWPDGRKVYNVPVALSIMVFFALCAQCASTLMVIRSETGSWLWPAVTFTYMTTLAYLGALLTYQIAMMFSRSA